MNDERELEELQHNHAYKEDIRKFRYFIKSAIGNKCCVFMNARIYDELIMNIHA